MYVPWGEFFRFQLGDQNLPGFGVGIGPGNFGSFTPNVAMPQANGTLATVYGDTWVAVIEFSEPAQAMAVTSYGNATQQGSPHVDDQLPLYAAKEYRPIWRTRAEIEAHLESRQTFQGIGTSK